MIIDKLMQKFLDNPSYFSNGAGFLAKNWNVTKEEVKIAKGKARQIQTGVEGIKVLGKELAENFLRSPNYIGSETSLSGEVTKKFTSDKPLTPQEIQELAGVDNINTFVGQVWDKLQANGQWTYSIQVKSRVKDFYNTKELKEKLAELMPKLEPYEFTYPETSNERALVICIADDHAGMVNTTNLFDSPQATYEDRLDAVFEEVSMLEQEFDEVHIISLGDQMNGWNSQTTRGGHEVKSLTNQEQFDIYVKARIKFYDKLFQSGITTNFFVHDVENSNHSGLGFSYMANRALELYIEGKYPQVYRESITDAIGGFQYGQHVVIMGHGKDEKYQKRPMPAVLNAATDLYLYDYLQNKGYSPYQDTISFYKGDLHQHGLQNGKFGRYVNVQSLAGNSDYGDANFGNTKGGALLEILHKDSYKITSQPIWF